MLKTKRITVAVMLLVMTVSISGCMVIDFFADLLDPSLIIIRGKKVISGEGEVYTIPKGTTVKFKWTGYFGGEVEGELVIKDGAKLIAQGTADEPIIFQEGSDETGGIIELQATASNDSVVEYCNFKTDIRLEVSNSITIQYNKFNDSSIDCYWDCSTLIQYNSFEITDDNLESIGISGITGNPTPSIQYNNIEGGDIGIGIGNNPNYIKHNNIIGTRSYAIEGSYLGDTYSIDDNHISDCNGKLGVDTDGSQCQGIIYNAYRNTLVEDAGCSW